MLSLKDNWFIMKETMKKNSSFESYQKRALVGVNGLTNAKWRHFGAAEKEWVQSTNKGGTAGLIARPLAKLYIFASG